MKKILVSGGLGYIGSHTCVELINAGYLPVVLDNLSNSEESVIGNLEKITGRSIPFHHVDCADFEALNRVFSEEKEAEGVIHFAAFKAVGESVRLPWKYYHNNVNSTLNILELTKKHKINNLVFSSSCTVYGQPDSLPVDEDTPMAQPESPYGHTKQICEKMIVQYHTSSELLRSVILRYFNPIGAHPSGLIGELPLGKPENLVPFITQTVAGIRDQLTVFGDNYNTPDGTCIRDYIHVVDLARAHVAALKYMHDLNSNNPSDIINLGLGRGFSVLEVLNTFESAVGKKVNYHIGPKRPGDVEKIYSSSDRAFEKLGWSCEYSLEDMLKHAWQWQENLKKN